MNVAGEPDHDPCVVLSACPARAVPVTAGSAVLAGGVTGAATTAPVAADSRASDPPGFVAVTRERIRLPTSSPVSV